MRATVNQIEFAAQTLVNYGQKCWASEKYGFLFDGDARRQLAF
jgi:hypothetical protein